MRLVDHVVLDRGDRIWRCWSLPFRHLTCGANYVGAGRNGSAESLQASSWESESQCSSRTEQGLGEDMKIDAVSAV